MTLLLMAAGRGSRYGKLKQFDELGPNGEFLMEFSMFDAINSGFDHIVVITQKDNVQFLQDHLENRLPDHVKVDVVVQELTDLPEGTSFSVEREKPWGTAHAVWSAREVIKGPFAVINADDYYGQAAYRNAAAFIRDNAEAEVYGLMGYTLKDTLSIHGSVSRGVCKRDGKRLISVEERLKLEQQSDKVVDLDTGLEFDGDELVSMNFWVCRPSIFEHIEGDLRTFMQDEETQKTGEVYLPFVVQAMLQQDKVAVEVIPSDSKWFGVTYADDKDRAVAQLQEMTGEGAYSAPLWAKVPS